jgi:hypothetical protein
MAARGIEKSSATALNRLAYMGKRGLGALEFQPVRGSHKESATPVAMRRSPKSRGGFSFCMKDKYGSSASDRIS